MTTFNWKAELAKNPDPREFEAAYMRSLGLEEDPGGEITRIDICLGIAGQPSRHWVPIKEKAE